MGMGYLCVCVCVCVHSYPSHNPTKKFSSTYSLPAIVYRIFFPFPGGTTKMEEDVLEAGGLGGATVGVKDEHRVSGELIAFLLAGIFNFEF